ncbi:MAG: hypothetical protein Q4F53_05125, partial [Nesterenkonia sp.]|nr:hypothetical protein [Nesterenkonia sp.]
MTPPTAGSAGFEEFPAQVKGGSWLSVALDSLAGTVDEVSSATDLSAEQLRMFASAGFEHVTSGTPTLHPRIVSAGATFGTLQARMAASQLTSRAFALIMREVYERYRGVEESILGLFDGGVRLLAFMVNINPAGGPIDGLRAFDQAYGAMPSLVRLGALAGTRGMGGLGRAGQAVMGWSLITAYGPDLRRPGQLWKDAVTMDVGEPADAGSHRAEGGAADYLDVVGEADGDIVISTVTHDDGTVSHMVHLPGLDVDPADFSAEDLADGRGLVAGADAMVEDSSVHSEAMVEALEAAGVADGESVYLSGYSLGGKQATDLAADDTFNERFDLGGVITLGAPQSQRTTPFGVPVTHFQDKHDPVPRFTAERGRTSSDRLTVEFDRPPQERQGLTAFGDNHPYRHNVDALRSLEHPDNDALDPDQRAALEAFAEAYDGDVQTQTFTGAWRHDLDPEAVEALEAEAQGLGDRVESGIERGRELAEEAREELWGVVPGDQRLS